MNRYSIGPADRPHAREFRDNLLGGNPYHSPGLQRVLNVMRTASEGGKYVLVVREPFRRYVLGRLPERRGEPVETLEEYRFDDPLEAEWTVFRLRWREHTGATLDFLPEALRDDTGGSSR